MTRRFLPSCIPDLYAWLKLMVEWKVPRGFFQEGLVYDISSICPINSFGYPVSYVTPFAIRDKWKKATEISNLSPQFVRIRKKSFKKGCPHFLKEGTGKLFFSSGDAVHFFYKLKGTLTSSPIAFKSSRYGHPLRGTPLFQRPVCRTGLGIPPTQL